MRHPPRERRKEIIKKNHHKWEKFGTFRGMLGTSNKSSQVDQDEESTDDKKGKANTEKKN